ncbi:hypothetical protein BASA81_002565 [Batrachochytrium salamandrivorans]|nr:hypothetical protein BASA81_002565 [Batrachochytrium salamandrivorans]
MKTLLLGVLLAVYVALADLPTQPAAFAGRGPLPMLAYSFRQSQCSEGAIVQDIGSTVLSLTRDSAATRCPVRTNANGTYQYAAVGVAITNPNSTKPMYSADAVNAFTSLTTTSASKKMSIEMWITPLSTSTDLQYLVEMGPDSGSFPGLGTGSGTYQFAIYLDTVTSSLVVEALIPTTATFTFVDANIAAVISGMASNLGKPYYIAISIDGLTSTSTATLYIAKKGDALVSASTAGGAFTKLALATGSILRVGSTKGNGQPNSNDRLPIAFYGEVNFLAFHTIAFTQPQAAAAYAGGLPNSQPSLLQSPPGISVTVDGIAAGAVIDLGAVLKYYDADGNTLNNYVLTAVPTKGDLLRNNVAITSADLTIGAGLVLKYRPVSGEFSCDVASVEPTCSTVYASFKVFASDGLCSPLSCNSPNNATVNVYVRDVYYKPVVTSTISVVKSNANVVFEITATDSNDVAPFTSPSRLHDSAAANNYTVGATVTFVQVESNGNRLVSLETDGSCSTTTLAANTAIPWATYGSVKKFAFCFVDAAHKTSTFQYYVSDKNGLKSDTQTATFTEPLQACAGPKPAGADAVCLSHGFETVDAASPSFIPVFLQATNTLGGVLTFKALTFPTHGKLYKNSGTVGAPALGDEIIASSVISAMTGDEPNALFVADASYFTRVGAAGFTNLAGQGFNGCTDAVSGCPITFTFAAVAGSSESELATYTLHVVSQASGYSLTVPTEVVKPTRDVAFTIAGVSVVDLDQDAYVVSVSLATTIGLLSLGTAPAGLSNNNSTACATFKDCSSMSFSSYPSQVNAALATLQLFYNTGFKNETHTVSVKIGAAAAKTITLELTDPIPLTPGSELDSATGAVIGGSVGGVVGLCLLLLLLLLCCRRKKERTVAKKEVDIENGGAKAKDKSLAALSPESPKAAPTSAAAAKPAAAAGGEEESVSLGRKHIDQRTGDVYFFNPKTGQSQWDPPTIKSKTGK